MRDMMLDVFLPMAAVLLVIPVCLTIYWARREKYSGANLVVITCLVVLSVTALRMPLYMQRGMDVGSSFFRGLVNGIQTIGVGDDLSNVIDSGVCMIDGVTKAQLEEMGMTQISPQAGRYAVFALGQYMVSIFICGFALIKTISKWLLRWQLKWCLRPVFFFSHLTEESILLARSIQDNMKECRKRGLFCFASAPKEMDEETAEIWRQADLKNAFQLSSSLAFELFPWFAGSVSCVLCHPEEQTNLKALSALLQEGSEKRGLRRRNMKYFIYAQSYQAELAIDALTARYIPGSEKNHNQIICMLNHRENLAVHILDQIPLHAYAACDENGGKCLNVLIGGSTPLAERFLRNAFSCGQMEDCRLSITLADPEAEACRQRLYTTAPLLAQTELPIVQDCGKLHFTTLPNHAAIADEALVKDAHYILLAYDNDDENMKAARRIRTLIQRQKLTDPQRAGQEIAIVYAVEDSAMNSLCREIDPVAETEGVRTCRMFPVGSRARQNHTDALFGHELLRRAFFLDLAYGGVTGVNRDKASLRKLQLDFVRFMNSAYDRRSSVSAALHIKYREHVWQDQTIPEKDKPAILAHAEHKRWNAYMIMAGYACPTREQLNGYFFTGADTHRSKLMKLHPCMVPSKRAITQRLWEPGSQPVDELDAMSLHIHAMLLERLAACLPGDMPAHPVPEDKARIVAAAQALTDEKMRKQALRMSKALFTDYKKFDTDIVCGTEAILRNASDPEIRAALRLFWLEARENDL